MPGCAMDLTPLLSISRTTEWSPFLLIGGWLLLVPAIGRIDLLILLLFLIRGPLVACIKEPDLGL
jgi:hypothetical protein